MVYTFKTVFAFAFSVIQNCQNDLDNIKLFASYV